MTTTIRYPKLLSTYKLSYTNNSTQIVEEQIKNCELSIVESNNRTDILHIKVLDNMNSRELPYTMCITKNPCSQSNTLLLQFDERPIDAVNASHDNIIIRPTPIYHKEKDQKTISSDSNLIRLVIYICAALMIIFTLNQESILEQEIESLQKSVLRLRTLQES